MEEDFNTFVDSLLVTAADQQTADKTRWVDFASLCQTVLPSHPPMWASLAREHIRGNEWGRFSIGGDGQGRQILKLTSSGLSRVAQVRVARRAPTIIERITGDTSQRLINIGNFVIAALALVVAIFAMLKD